MSTADLLPALDRLIEASNRATLEHIERRMALCLRSAFVTQGVKVAKGYHSPHGVDGSLAATQPAFDAALSDGAERALGLGFADAAAMLGVTLAEAETLPKVRMFRDKVAQTAAYVTDARNVRWRSLEATTRQRLDKVLNRSASEGWGYARTERAIRREFRDMAASRADMIARTECFPGETLVGPAPELVAAPSHAGGFLGAMFRSGGLGPVAWVAGATRRWYEGRLIHVTTAGGHELSGTPNHPVLTDRGWVALGGLIEGDYLIRRAGRQEVGFRHPDVDHMPTPISEVFDALRACSLVGVQRIRGSHMDFHGDGMAGEVEVVWADRKLGFGEQAALLQPFGHQRLAVADEGAAPLLRFGLGGQMGGALRLSTSHTREFTHAAGSGGVGVDQRGPAFIGIPIRPHGLAGFGQPANGDAGGYEDAPQRPGINAVVEGDGLAGFSGGVAADCVVRVEGSFFTGHVYNLVTQNQRYMANGIVVHNCANAYESARRIVAQGVRADGEVVEQRWLVTYACCDLCAMNEQAGWLPLDAPFPSGDDRPPQHPRCRCSVSYRAATGAESEE